MPLTPTLALLLLWTSADAARFSVRTAPCPIGGGPVRVVEQVSSDTFGGFDSDLAAYSAQGQFRQHAISTCPDNLLSLYGTDIGRIPLDEALSARLVARIEALRPSLPPPDQLEVWDRYGIAHAVYAELGRDPLFLADLRLRATWTARDEAVGIYEGLGGPIAARALLDAGAAELDKDLPPRQRKIVLHNLARVAHRGGWSAERDQHLAAFEAVGELDAAERAALDRFHHIADEVEPRLQDLTIEAYRLALIRPGVEMPDKVRATYILADLLRRRGRYAEAFSLFSRVMVERTAPLNLKEMAGFLSRDLIERYPEAVGDKQGGSAPSVAPR